MKSLLVIVLSMWSGLVFGKTIDYSNFNNAMGGVLVDKASGLTLKSKCLDRQIRGECKKVGIIIENNEQVVKFDRWDHTLWVEDFPFFEGERKLMTLDVRKIESSKIKNLLTRSSFCGEKRNGIGESLRGFCGFLFHRGGVLSFYTRNNFYKNIIFDGDYRFSFYGMAEGFADECQEDFTIGACLLIIPTLPIETVVDAGAAVGGLVHDVSLFALSLPVHWARNIVYSKRRKKLLKWIDFLINPQNHGEIREMGQKRVVRIASGLQALERKLNE